MYVCMYVCIHIYTYTQTRLQKTVTGPALQGQVREPEAGGSSVAITGPGFEASWILELYIHIYIYVYSHT